LGDVVSGKNIKQTLKERGIKRTVADVIGQSQPEHHTVDVTPAPKRDKPSTVTKKEKKNTKKRRAVSVTPTVKTKDIFD